METSSTSAQRLAPLYSQRFESFLQGDGLTFAGCTVGLTGFQLMRELHLAPHPHQFRHAISKTAHMAPAIAFSVALGIIGMNASISAIQELKRKDNRVSIFAAFPLAGGLIFLPKGPIAMVKGAAVFGLGAVGISYLIEKTRSDTPEKK